MVLARRDRITCDRVGSFSVPICNSSSRLAVVATEYVYIQDLEPEPVPRKRNDQSKADASLHGSCLFLVGTSLLMLSGRSIASLKLLSTVSSGDEYSLLDDRAQYSSSLC